MVVRHYENF